MKKGEKGGQKNAGLSRYEQRGVSSEKKEVHAAIAHLDKGLFPGAFCKILPDILAGSPRYCNISHSDGAGTKAVLAYLIWKWTGDLRVWKGIIRDSMFMNLDDMMCAGALGPFLVTLTINRNKALIPGEVISILIQECQEVCDWLTGFEIQCRFAGGETADVGDLVRTITVDNNITVRFKRSEVIDAGRIRPGAFIVGFSSTGQASWEDVPNSGMGSNGLTSARHDVLSREYRKHKETYAPETDKKLVYCGKHAHFESLSGDIGSMTIGQALLSPTRTYLPLAAKLFKEIGRKSFLGLIHCSGGGQTKIGKFGPKGILYLKSNPFPVPPLFRMLMNVRGLTIREAYQTYNMGHRFEAVIKTMKVANQCIEIARDCGIEAKIVGKVYLDETNPSRRSVVSIKTGSDNWENYVIGD